MIFDRIMLPAQGRNEDYKFAQTGSVTLVAGMGGAGGAAPTPSWLENVIKLDPESGFLSVDDWHVKGDLIIEGQVNQWLAQQLVVDDARIQVNRQQDGAVVDSGLVIFDKDTSSEVSSLLYDVDGVWKAGGDRLFTDAYNPKLGGYAAGDYPRKAEDAVITGAWTLYRDGIDQLNLQRGGASNPALTFSNTVDGTLAQIFGISSSLGLLIRPGNTSGDVYFKPTGLGLGVVVPTERLHVAGNGLFTGNLSAPTFVSGFAGSGWRLEAGEENHLTIDRLTVRGRMDVYELVVNQIRGTNGAQWVSDSAKVESVSGNRLFIDTGGDTSFVPFAVNDLLRCQRWNGKNIKYYVVRVTAVGSNYIDVVLVDGSSPREAGDHLVRMGNTVDTNRQGALYLTSSDSNAPYMDVLDGVNSASFAGKTKVRIGRLDGITDPDLGTLSGYGLYTENGYFKGKIQVTGGNAATKADVDAVQVGGRNLFFKSGFSSGTSGNDVTGWGRYEATSLQVEDDKPFSAPGVNAISWVIESGVSYGGYYQRFRSPDGLSVTDYFKAGEQYTVSAWIKASSAANIRIHAEGLATKSITATTEWKKYSLTFTGDGVRHTIAFYGYVQGVRYYLCMPKLETGNRATDWTPAPEDVPSALDYLATAIQDGTTDIEGGLINTNVLMVKDTNGAVSGGISGLASDNVGFWTGGSYQDAINDNANVIFRKDGSFSLAGGKISGTSDGALSVDAGVVTGFIESANYDGIVGSRFDLYNGHLLIGDVIRMSGDVSEIQVRNRDTGLDSFRIGDFILTPPDFAGEGIDVLLGSGSVTASAASGGFSVGATAYVSGTGNLSTSSSQRISNSLIIGGLYNFQTKFKITLSPYLQIGTEPGIFPEIFEYLSGSGIKVQLKNGNTVVWERSIYTIPPNGVIPLLISTSFQAVNSSLQLMMSISGEYRYRVPSGTNTRHYNTTVSISRYDSSSRLVLQALINRMEFSTRGMQTVFSSSNYFRCVSTGIEGRGVQTFISPDGIFRLRISNSGIQKSTNGGQTWTPL